MDFDREMELEKLERVSREHVYKGAIIDLYKDTIKNPDGTIEYYDFIKHKGASAVIPVMDDGRIIMVKQYRNALDRFTVEIPAGGRNTENEDFKECAARELEEETGYKSDDLELLITVRTTIAFCNEAIDIYVARNLVPSKQNLDPGEYINVEIYTIEELVNLVFEGKIQDAKTVAAIMAYNHKFGNK